MNLRHLLPFAGILTLTLASCTAGSDGIFASIEKEKKVVHTGNLSTTSTITHMAELGTKYYATGGRALFSRDITSSTWSKSTSVSPASTVTHYFEAIGSTGTSGVLYAIANSGDSSTNALYASQDGETWTAVDLGAYSPLGLVPVRNNDGSSSEELVVTSSTCDRVWLFTGNALPSGTQAGVLLDSTVAGGNPITAAVKNAAAGATGDYYLVNESFIYHLTSGFSTPTKVSGVSSYHGFTGILLLGTSTSGVSPGIYVTTRSRSDTGGDFLFWAIPATGSETTFGTVTVIKSDFQKSSYPVWLDQMLISSSGLWIGTGPGTTSSGYEGYGYANYYDGTFSMDPPDGTDESNFTSSDLYTFSIPLLFKSSSGDYFIGTASHGLWHWVDSVWEQQ